MEAGDHERSPLPFRVHAVTGKPGFFFDNAPGPDFFSNDFSGKKITEAVYTANWTGTLTLLEELMELDSARRTDYEQAFRVLLDWMKAYPLKTNKWGPFFEDIPGWSDTQTNALTFAMFILQHQALFPNWREEIKGIIDWTYAELGNHEYEPYKVVVMNEQTVYRVPGNSHSSRQASVELMYAALSGDTTYTANALRTLNWATYTVADDGRNRYIRDDIWLTDGYGDYVRHYLRAMAAMPELAPSGKNRLLGSSTVVTRIEYKPNTLEYATYGAASDVLRLIRKPRKINCDGVKLKPVTDDQSDGYTWTPLAVGGILTLKHRGKEVKIDL
jgi:hypothetical protein